MPRLIWDEPGKRFYEAGVDRGVLYDSNNQAHAWNGLTAVEEDFGDVAVDPRYFEGQKRYDLPNTGDYSGTLRAYTYPDEFLEYEGTYQLEDGLYVGDQNPKTFGLSYRTKVGNDTLGTNYGYKIHVLYGLTATPSSKNFESISDKTDPMEFEWAIHGLPSDAPGYKPTAHLIFDSRTIDPTLMWVLENTFYGNEGTNGRLMPLAEVIQYTKDNWS